MRTERGRMLLEGKQTHLTGEADGKAVLPAMLQALIGVQFSCREATWVNEIAGGITPWLTCTHPLLLY